MNAAAVCKRLLTLSLEQPHSGTVHSVFDHAVNLELGGAGLIGLIAQEKALTPYMPLPPAAPSLPPLDEPPPPPPVLAVPAAAVPPEP